MNQQRIFGRIYPLAKWSGTESKMIHSADIVNKAIIDINPYAICLMLSGGDDSVTALKVAVMLGIHIDFIIHGVTGTGLPCVREYVHNIGKRFNIPVLEANAGDAFEKYVVRKGFFGIGKDAHKFSYHLLKVNPFDKAISKNIRRARPGRKIMLLNGVRIEESANRLDNFGDETARWTRNDYWVNIIHYWTKQECLDLLTSESIERNPASIHLGRSSECNCGTAQMKKDLDAAAKFDPIWGKKINDLRQFVIKKHGWDMCENPSKELIEIRKAAESLPDFMPACVSCKVKWDQQQLF